VANRSINEKWYGRGSPAGKGRIWPRKGAGSDGSRIYIVMIGVNFCDINSIQMVSTLVTYAR
jgi:hypothetical protein